MIVYLLDRHIVPKKYDRERYTYYTDSGIEVSNWWYLSRSATILGLVWKGDQDSPLLIKVVRFGRTYYLGLIPDGPYHV